MGDTPPKARGDHPPESKGQKVYPIQVNPLKAFPIKAKANALSAEMELNVWQRLRASIPDLYKSQQCFKLLMKQNPDKFERVLADLEARLKDQHLERVRSPGAYFNESWKQFSD
jgi:hypothetical protein